MYNTYKQNTEILNVPFEQIDIENILNTNLIEGTYATISKVLNTENEVTGYKFDFISLNYPFPEYINNKFTLQYYIINVEQDLELTNMDSMILNTYKVGDYYVIFSVPQLFTSQEPNSNNNTQNIT